MAEDAKKEFIKLYTTNIKREGADKLLEWLCDKSDFFEAPASSKYHNAFEGGLCAHSLNVARRLKLLVDTEKKLCPGKESVTHITDESVIICGLLHDVCKANFYKVDFRNKKEDGEWVRVPYYTIDEELPYGHGEKSVYIINGYMRLTREEALAINWHMGGYDVRVKGGDYSISSAFEKYPLAVLTHIADIQASYLDERCE